MANKISVEVDVNTKEVKFAGGEVTRLSQQVRLLTDELNKMQKAGEVGSEKYQILVEKLNDTKDAMDRTKLAAGEIYGTLSAMPGPIGQIGSSLNTTIDSFKLLGSLKTTELRAQFTGLLKDVKEAGQGFLNFIGFTKLYEARLAALTASKNKDTTATIVNTEATQASSAAEKQKTVATVADTAATNANTTATVTASAATRAFAAALAALPFVLIGAAIAALIVYWEDLVDVMTGATKESKALKEAQKEVATEVKDFNSKLLEVKQTLKLAEAGTIDKKEALKKYNDELGESIGYANSLEQAENLLAANTDTYVKVLALRTQAQFLYGKSAEASAKLISGEGLEPTFWEKTWNMIKAGGNPFIALNNDIETFSENIAETSGEVKLFEDAGNRLLTQAGELAATMKKGLPKPPEETKPKTQAEKDKEQIDALNRSIQLEIDARNTNKENLEKYLTERRALTQKYEKLQGDDLKNALEKDRTTVENALKTDKDARYKIGEDIIKDTREQSKRQADESLAALQTALDDELSAITIQENKLKENKNLTEKELIQIGIDARKKREQAELAFAEKQLAIIKGQKQKEIEAIDKAVKDGVVTVEDGEKLKQKIIDDYAEKLLSKERDVTKKKVEIVVNGSKDIADANKKEKDDAAKALDDQLKILQMQGENMATWSKAYYDNRKKQLDSQLAKELEGVEKYSEAYYRILERYALMEEDLEKQKTRSRWQAAGQAIAAAASVFDALAGLLDAEAENNKEAFEKRKKFQIASAVMNVASGIIGVWTNPPFGPGTAIWKAIQTALLVTTTAIQIAKISKSKFEPKDTKSEKSDNAIVGSKFAQGGLLVGPSHSQGGIKSPFGELEGGEYVVNKRSTRSFMPLLSAINSVGNRKYQDGGMMATMDSLKDLIEAQQTTPIIKTYVVASEMTSQQEADKKLRDLAKI